MGCFPSRKINNDLSEPMRSLRSEKQSIKKEIKTKDDVDFSTADLITQKNGKITTDYTILSPPLGKGAYGEVRKAIHKKTGFARAIKIMSKSLTSKEEQEKLLNEVNILKELDHPNIIKIFEFYQDERYFYIVTELCTGGELFDKIIEAKYLTEKKAAEILRQVLGAVYYCHCHQIVHRLLFHFERFKRLNRDIKPENLLFETQKDDSVLKVIDFGTSKVFDPTRKMDQKFGTPYYIAPEVLKRKYNEKCDVWSCGVILYVILCGYPPFNGPNDNVIMEKVSKGVFNFDGEEWLNVSSEAKSLISKMLEYDPEKRYTAQQALNDPWLKKNFANTEHDLTLMSKALGNMRSFRAERKLQEATWVFLVNYLASKEEKAQLLKIFQSLDLNGDGQLSREELITGYRKMMNEVEANEIVNKIMQTVDKNNNGAIDYTEFVVATMNRENLLSKQRLDIAFKMFDKDGSGSVSIEELKEIFGGGKIPDEVWKEMIKEVDQNGDGEISLKEFREMMQKISCDN